MSNKLDNLTNMLYIMPRRPEERMESKTMREKLRCFSPGYLLLALGAAAVIIVAAIVAKGYPKGSAVRIALALVQGIATGFVVVMPWWQLRRLDEMLQRIQLEALSIAFFATGLLAAGYGFLESAGLPHIDWGTVIWPVMVGLWALGLIIAWRRYR